MGERIQANRNPVIVADASPKWAASDKVLIKVHEDDAEDAQIGRATESEVSTGQVAECLRARLGGTYVYVQDEGPDGRVVVTLSRVQLSMKQLGVV